MTTSGARACTEAETALARAEAGLGAARSEENRARDARDRARYRYEGARTHRNLRLVTQAQRRYKVAVQDRVDAERVVFDAERRVSRACR